MINFLLSLWVKSLLWLRYRVVVRGAREIVATGRRGILFLSNHTALIDPIILAVYLHKWFHPKFLADRGWGRAVEQSVQLRLEAGQSPEVLDALPTSDLLNVIKAIQSPPSEETVDGHVLQANNAIPEVLKDNPAAEAIIDVVLKREDA